MDAKLILIAALIVITIVYAFSGGAWRGQKRAAGGHGAHEPVTPTPLHIGIGFVTNFFDTLGIGSFATTTAMFRLWKLVPDEQIPGTLNVGHMLPTVVQAIIYTQIVEVEFTTLVLMIAAAVRRARGSAPASSPGCPRRNVQIGMGIGAPRRRDAHAAAAARTRARRRHGARRSTAPSSRSASAATSCSAR